MTTNLEYYKVFYYVALHGSLTVAASKLNVSQPAVSQALKSLEGTLGVKLFRRVSKGVEMTREAAVLFEHIERAYKEIDAGEAKLKGMLNLDEGEVRIGASDMTLRFFLLPYLEKYHELHPNIKITVTNAPTPETLQNLKNHTVDFGIVSTPFEEYDYLKKVTVRPIEDTFVAGRKYLKYRNRTLDFKELENLPLVALEGKTSTKSYMEAFLSENGVTIKPEFELATSDMIVQFAVKNLGIGCVMKDFALPYLEDGTLFELRFSKLIPKREMCIVYDERSSISKAALALLSIMSEE